MPSPDLVVGPDREIGRILQECDKLLKQGRRAREPFEAEWYLNVAFFQGEQWLSWARTRFARPVVEKWRTMFTDNRVQPAVLTEVARLTKNRPVWEAVPTAPSDEALEDAILAQRLLQGKWSDLGLQQLLRRVTTWSRVTGAGFLKVTWDPDAGDGTEIAVDKAGEPLENPKRGGLLRREDVPVELHGDMRWKRAAVGDIRVNVRSPFDVYVDPLAGDEGMASARWLIEEAVRAPEDVQDRYGLEQLPKADSDASPGIFESRRPGTNGLSQDEKVGVRVFELWEKPTRRFPEGRHVVWTDKALLAYEKNSTKGGELPYVMFVGVPTPGRFWPSSMATQIRPLNQELNKTRSQMRENAARMGNPALLVPNDMVGFQWHGAPGEQVPIDPYAPNQPQFLVPPGIPRSVTDEVGMIENAIDRGSMQGDVSRGQVPAGVTAASAIQLLQEADQTRIGMDAQDFEDSISRTGRFVLDLACAFYKSDRLIQIGGDDEDWDITSFRADQLKQDVPTVQVKPGSMIPQSVAARQALMEHVLTLFLQNGVQMDPAALGTFLRQFEVGGLENLVSGFTDDARKIAAENRQLARPGTHEADMPAVVDWDNHAAHLRGHEKWMKSKQFQLAPDEIQQRFRVHWEAHKDAITRLALADAQKQSALQAAAAGPPAAPAGPDMSGGAPDAIVPQPGGADVPADEAQVPGPPAAPPAPGV